MRDTRTGQHQPRPLIDLSVSIVLPSLIMMKLSSDSYLGVEGALMLALSFPLGWGLFEGFYYRKFNWIAFLGLVSVVLTGGIGLLHLDSDWLAIKEAAIPGIIGMAILISAWTPYPLIHALIYNPAILDIEKIRQHLEHNGHIQAFDLRLKKATYWLSGTFFFSSAMNYLLARWLVHSPSGSEAFNQELGHMTLLSYPVIAIPSTLMMAGILYYLWRTIHGFTGLALEDILAKK